MSGARELYINDPAIRLEILEERARKRASEQAGRIIGREEFETIRQAADEDNRQKYEIIKQKIIEAKSNEYTKKRYEQNDIERRRRARNDIPSNYSIPSSIDDIKSRLSDGQCYFDGLRLNGDENGYNVDLDMRSVRCRNANIQNVEITKNWRLNDCDFCDSIFEDVKIAKDVDLRNARFDNCEMKNVTFSDGAKVTGASFRSAKMDSGCAILFDRNAINDMESLMVGNVWRKLIQSYSPVVQFMEIAFAMLYFGPLLIRIDLTAALAEPISMILRRLDPHETREWAVWQVVLGRGEPFWLGYATAIIFIIYHGLRLVMAKKVSYMLHELKYSGQTPSAAEYRSAYRKRRATFYMLTFVVGVFAWELISNLLTVISTK